ncbi:hypothetical protein KP509_10G057500 [Ceratopteris richardii]|nr:hypothetical protein KP509_10G057500 [Ceratopteris richardii]
MANSKLSSAINFVKKHPITLCGLPLLFIPSVHRLLFYFTPLLISTSIFILAMVTWGPNSSSDKGPKRRLKRSRLLAEHHEWAFNESLDDDDDDDDDDDGDDEGNAAENSEVTTVEKTTIYGEKQETTQTGNSDVDDALHDGVELQLKVEADPDLCDVGTGAHQIEPEPHLSEVKTSARQIEPDPDLGDLETSAKQIEQDPDLINVEISAKQMESDTDLSNVETAARQIEPHPALLEQTECVTSVVRDDAFTDESLACPHTPVLAMDEEPLLVEAALTWKCDDESAEPYCLSASTHAGSISYEEDGNVEPREHNTVEGHDFKNDDGDGLDR